MSALPRYAMTYVVWWPHAGVLKVGRAWKFHRVQMMVRSGAHVLILARGTDATWEREALRSLARWFPRAFTRPRDAEALLFMGRGFTECFTVPEHYLQLAIDLCFEGFARGNDQGWNDAHEATTAGDPARAMDPRSTAEGTEAGPVDGHGVVGHRGRRGPARAATRPDRRLPVSGRPGNDGGRDRGAPARAGRRRVPHDLHRGRADTAAAGLPAADSTTRPVTPATACPVTGSGGFRNVPGCGGRAGAGGREGASRGERACSRVGCVGAGSGTRAHAGPTDAAGRPTDRLPGAPERPIRRLRTLRHGPTPTRALARSAASHRAARPVRGIDWWRLMSEYVIDLDELADLEHEANAYAEWRAGKVRPWRITTALNLRGLYGPEVDVACLAVEPEVDWWEEAILYPTWDQLLALAGLTDMLPGWFTRDGDPPVTTTAFLCTSGRGGGCQVIEPPAVVHLTYSADVVAATVGATA